MDTAPAPKGSLLKNRKLAVTLWVVIAVVVIMVISGGSSKDTFPAEARARFNDILKTSPELEAINCEGDCTNVVYFDYKTIPNDLETVIRGNAATFSKFKLDKKGVSNVSIVARTEGRVLFSCDASQGKVDVCK